MLNCAAVLTPAPLVSAIIWIIVSTLVVTHLHSVPECFLCVVIIAYIVAQVSHSTQVLKQSSKQQLERHSRGATLRYMIEPGAALHPIESVITYGLTGWYGTVGGEWGDELHRRALANATWQLRLFALVAHLPTYLTGQLRYVDIAWPLGLCVIAYHTLMQPTSVCAKLVGGALMLHGARMSLGSLTSFPYVWGNDSSRYEYARDRWNQKTRTPQLWWVKQQHDVLMQCFANCVTLAAPMLIIASNPRRKLHPIEACGVTMWLVSWLMESLADWQMNQFRQETEGNGDTEAVIGHDEYAHYWMWSMSRHPNYFFEWMCWNSFTLAAIPSVMDLCRDQTQSRMARIGSVVIVASVPRLTYDCLMYWTGAAPAEARSVKKRKKYRAYQETVPAFFPVKGIGHGPIRDP